MKKLQFNTEHKALIESVIKENPNYNGNEELIDIFCEAIYKKSYLLIDAIKDLKRLKRHLTTIADSTMEQIVKQKLEFNGLKRNKQPQNKNNPPNEGLVTINPKKQSKKNINENKLVNIKKPKPLSINNSKNSQELENINLFEESNQNTNKDAAQFVSLKEELVKNEKYGSTNYLIDPAEIFPQREVSENTVKKLVKIVREVDRAYPKKRYYEIFALRYLRGLNQAEIAHELNISQVELSKRFIELIKLSSEKAQNN